MPRSHPRTVIDPLSLEKKIAELLDAFFQKRIDKLNQLQLREKLKDKSPYLMRAIGVADASEIIEEILDAHISSSDETLFGNIFFEPLAQWVAEEAYKGHAAVVTGTTKGIDISLQHKAYVESIAVKSGVNSFNAQSKERQKQDLKEYRDRVRKLGIAIFTVIGYCYGTKKQRIPNGSVAEVEELAGHAFWAHLTNDADFYLKIINLMKTIPALHRQTYLNAYNQAKNKFVREFSKDYTLASGDIDWDKLVKENSGPRVKGPTTPKPKVASPNKKSKGLAKNALSQKAADALVANVPLLGNSTATSDNQIIDDLTNIHGLGD